MKILFIRIKLFFTSPYILQSIQQFMVIFFIVFLLTLSSAVYFVYFHNDSERALKRELWKIFSEPRSFNKEKFLEYDNIPFENKSQFVEDPNFWESTAVHYRYTIPKDGVPKNHD